MLPYLYIPPELQSLNVKMLTKSQLAHFRVYNLGKIEPTLQHYNYPKLHLDLEKVLVLYLLPFKYQIRLDFWHFPKPNIRDFWKIGLGRKLKYLRAEYICHDRAFRLSCLYIFDNWFFRVWGLGANRGGIKKLFISLFPGGSEEGLSLGRIFSVTFF